MDLIEMSLGRRLVAPTSHLCAITDIGLCRSTNQDDFFIAKNGQIWIVADGMGGQPAGRQASALAIRAIADSLWSPPFANDAWRADIIDVRLVEAFTSAQQTVLEYGSKHQECLGMGSAALAVWLDDASMHVCHAGDVRCYVLSQRILRQVTQDHSLVAKLVRLGLLPSDQARVHPEKSRLEQGIGLKRGFTPEVTRHELLPNDRVLVCTDGLWEALSDAEIGAILSSNASIRHITTTLIDHANGRGGQDNITAVVYQHLPASS